VISTSLGSDSGRTADRAEARFGVAAPPLLRCVGVAAWLAVVIQFLSLSLPGSASGIEAWIRRVDLTASLATQLSALLGSIIVVTLVVNTLSDRNLGYAYRIVVVPAAAAVLVPAMLSLKFNLEPEANFILGIASLVLAAASASAALRAPSSRAHGMVLSLVTLAAASRFGTRVLVTGTGAIDATWAGRAAWLASAGHAFDAFAVAMTAARLRAEQRSKGAFVLVACFLSSFVVAWGALRGSLEGARTWQVVLSRALGEMTASPVMFSTLQSRYAIEALALFLSLAIVVWPRRISAGLVTAALALLCRPGVDVPAAALVLAVSALSAPLGVLGDAGLSEVTRPDRSRGAPAGADTERRS
jgi:hypothetical protein